MLAPIGDERAHDWLLKMVGHRDEWVRWYAVEGLGNIGDSRAIEALVCALFDNTQYCKVGECSARSLEKIDRDWPRTAGARAAIPFLATALASEDSSTRQVALATLNRIDSKWMETSGARDGVLPLISALKKTDRSCTPYRKDILQSLGSIADPRAMGALIECCSGGVETNAVVSAMRRILDRSAGQVADEHLNGVVALKDVTQIKFGWSCAFQVEEGREKIDTSGVTQIARQELIRRGLAA